MQPANGRTGLGQQPDMFRYMWNASGNADCHRQIKAMPAAGPQTAICTWTETGLPTVALGTMATAPRQIKAKFPQPTANAK